MLEKYIHRNFLRFFILNMLIFIGIIWLTRIVKYLDFVTDKNMHMLDFLILILLLLPRLGDFLIPVVIFASIIFSYNNLTNSKEIFVIKSAGVSRLKILKIYSKVVLLIILFNYLLSFYLVPLSMRGVDELKLKLANELIINSVEAGSFNKISPEITVYVEDKEQNILKNIFIYQKDQAKSTIITTAKKGEIVRNKKQILLALETGNRITIGENKYANKFLTFDKYITDLDMINNVNKKLQRKNDISNLYFHELLTLDSDSNKHKAEIHHRIIWPFLSMVIFVVVLTIMMFGDYNRNGHTKRVLTAIIVALIILVAYFIAKDQFTNRIELVFATYISIVIIPISMIFANQASRIRLKYDEK